MNSEHRVLKHPLSSRLFHWGLILGFLPAALTGLIIWLKPGGDSFVNLAMKIHIAGAFILSISAALYFILALKRVCLFIDRSFSWNADDISWMMTMMVTGGYVKKILFGKEPKIPLMGKVNSGQKLFSVLLLTGGVFLILSGWVLWAFIPVAPKTVVYWLNTGHLIFGLLLSMFLCVHIFLGIYFREEFKTMFGDGTQDLHIAEHHTPLWVTHEVEPVVKAGR